MGAIFLLRKPLNGILTVMEMDPHTLQQILDRIQQQVRCPQCGKEVPADFQSVKVVSESAMLLQLQCDHCNAYVVLQASLSGIEQISAPPYEEDKCANASTGISSNKGDISQIQEALKGSGGSFSSMFKEKEKAGKTSKTSKTGKADTEIA